MYNVLFTLNFELSWYGTSYRTFLQPKIQSWREICSKLRRWKMLPGVQRMIHSKHAQFLQYCLSLQYYAHISGICPTWDLMEDRRGIDITILIEQAPIPGAQSCISSPYLSLVNIPCYLLCTVCERGIWYLWNSPVFQRCSEREYIMWWRGGGDGGRVGRHIQNILCTWWLSWLAVEGIGQHWLGNFSHKWVYKPLLCLCRAPFLALLTVLSWQKCLLEGEPWPL